MGCINSKKELKGIRTNSNRIPNVYRVYACRILADAGTVESGYLELSPKELTFLPEMGQTIKWALQHLRRYGCTGDVFSFEAGRRCMTGPGIYTFRCHNAENMHHLFQSYINNTVARNDETAPMICTDFPNSLDSTTSNSHDTYLEPTLGTSSVLYNRSNLIRRDSAQSSPLSSNLNSPISLQGVNFTNEVIHINAQPSKHVNPNSNVYQEFPIKINEFNNNIPNKIKSHDVPPQELAPNVQNLEIDILHPRKYLAISDEQHMYENVNSLEKSSSSERCYENFSSIDLPILQADKTKTPGNENSTVVNYITLDLVQSPTSTDSFSLKLKQNAETSTACNNSRNDINNEIARPYKSQEYTGNYNSYTKTSAELAKSSINTLSDNQSSSMGYSTIDFIKTCALIKSVPHCNADCQESRITRHSTCVLKNSSLSE